MGARMTNREETEEEMRTGRDTYHDLDLLHNRVGMEDSTVTSTDDGPVL